MKPVEGLRPLWKILLHAGVADLLRLVAEASIVMLVCLRERYVVEPQRFKVRQSSAVEAVDERCKPKIGLFAERKVAQRKGVEAPDVRIGELFPLTA